MDLLEGASSPIVVKLADLTKGCKKKPDMVKVRCSPNRSIFGNWCSGEEEVSIGFSPKFNIEEGEIWLIFPAENKAKRFFRPSSNSNTLLFTERCDQKCIMCSQPPKNKDYLYWDLYFSALKELPNKTFFGISGGEPLLEKEQLFELLRKVISIRPDLKFHILTNAQHFSSDDISELTSLNKNILWGIPLYSTNDAIHDKIVGKKGAFENLLGSMTVLYQSGAQIELRTVLLQQNVGYLSHIVNFIADKMPWISYWALMQLEPIGFARIEFLEKFYDHSQNFELVKLALDSAKIRGVTTKLYNFPSCTVNKPYRELSNKSISDWKNKFLDICSGCKEKQHCSGFFEWYNHTIGYQNLGTKYL